MIHVKFCGMRRDEDIAAVNRLLPEYVGFVFWPRSKRYVTPDQAKSLSEKLDSRITPVGVFLDEPFDNVVSIASSGCIRMIQLHGRESEEYLVRIREETGLPVIRAYTVKTAEEVAEAEKTSADYLMLDNGAGTGNTFDWNILSGVKRPYFLAGGLNPENIGNAIKQLHPFAVDTSSGIETDDAKDAEKMQAFIRTVRED